MRPIRLLANACALAIWIGSTVPTLAHGAEQIQDPIHSKDAKATQGRYIEVDTRDPLACAYVLKTISPLQELKVSRPRHEVSPLSRWDFEALCKNPSRHEPIVSVLIYEPTPKESEFIEIKKRMRAEIKALNQNQRFKDQGFSGQSPSGLIWVDAQPTFDIPNDAELETRDRRYRDPNEKIAPAIRHPISGAASYTMARTSGRSQLEAFGRSLMMSTYYWQPASGLPNTEDVIVGPIFSSMLGELIYQTAANIRENDGKVLGSRTLGVAALVVVDPAGSIADGVNRLSGQKVITQASGELVAGRRRPDPRLPFQSLSGEFSYIGVRFHFQFWGL